MAQAGQSVEVKWLPFQLNANASKTGVNKMQMYMDKFQKTKEEVVQMSAYMKGNFERAGLPYSFTEHSLTGNTFNSHRLVAFAGSQGESVQDAVVEDLFRAYFADEQFLNDKKVLMEAALKGGIEEATARQLVDDESQYAAETTEELQLGRQLGVTGVPFFVLENDSGKQVTLSGAQPPETFVAAFHSLA